MALNINANINISRVGVIKIPISDVGKYTIETKSVGSDTYLVDQSGNGNDILIVSGGVSGGVLTPNTVLRMPSAYWDKSDTGTWVTGNFFYYNSGNTRDWRVDELHYRLINEVFGVNPTHRTFGRQMWANEVFTGLAELVLYDTEQTQLSLLRGYIGMRDFQNQGNYYYIGEWTIRDILQFVVEGTTFDMDLASASSDTAYWGDGTSDTVTANATYGHTWTYGGKHLVSVTNNLTRFGISSRVMKGDIAYWASAIANWTKIVTFFINNNQFTGDLSSWASAIANWTKIVTFLIYSNNFTGELSSWAGALANWTRIVNFYINDNQFSYIVAPEQSRGAGYLLQSNLALVDNINALLEGQYNYYLANNPERDLSINISGMPVPTYDYTPLSTLFTNAGHVLTVITD